MTWNGEGWIMVSGPELVTYLTRTSLFEWWVARCRSTVGSLKGIMS